MFADERRRFRRSQLALLAERFPFLCFFLCSLDIPEMEVVLIVLVQLNFEHQVEHSVLFARLSNLRASLQVRCLIDFVGYCSADDLFTEGDDWFANFGLVLISEIAEGPLRDLYITTDKVSREPRFKLHQLTLEQNIVETLGKQILAGD